MRRLWPIGGGGAVAPNKQQQQQLKIIMLGTDYLRHVTVCYIALIIVGDTDEPHNTITVKLTL
jgi:hypothetical protein